MRRIWVEINASQNRGKRPSVCVFFCFYLSKRMLCSYFTSHCSWYEIGLCGTNYKLFTIHTKRKFGRKKKRASRKVNGLPDQIIMSCLMMKFTFHFQSNFYEIINLALNNSFPLLARVMCNVSVLRFREYAMRDVRIGSFAANVFG